MWFEGYCLLANTNISPKSPVSRTAGVLVSGAARLEKEQHKLVKSTREGRLKRTQM